MSNCFLAGYDIPSSTVVTLLTHHHMHGVQYLELRRNLVAADCRPCGEWRCASTDEQSGIFFCFIPRGGEWELGIFFDARVLISRVSAKLFFGYFFRLFWCFCVFWGVFLCFFFLFFFRALARNLFWFFLRRGREQNREFPLCRRTRSPGSN